MELVVLEAEQTGSRSSSSGGDSGGGFHQPLRE